MSSSNPGGSSGGRAKCCPTAVALFACAALLAAPTVLAVEISFRSFSGSAAIGPPSRGRLRGQAGEPLDDRPRQGRPDQVQEVHADAGDS